MAVKMLRLNWMFEFLKWEKDSESMKANIVRPELNAKIPIGNDLDLIRFPLVQYPSSRWNRIATRLATVAIGSEWKKNASEENSYSKKAA
jgi:hypothetical protein